MGKLYGSNLDKDVTAKMVDCSRCMYDRRFCVTCEAGQVTEAVERRVGISKYTVS